MQGPIEQGRAIRRIVSHDLSQLVWVVSWRIAGGEDGAISNIQHDDGAFERFSCECVGLVIIALERKGLVNGFLKSTIQGQPEVLSLRKLLTSDELSANRIPPFQTEIIQSRKVGVGSRFKPVNAIGWVKIADEMSRCFSQWVMSDDRTLCFRFSARGAPCRSMIRPR